MQQSTNNTNIIQSMLPQVGRIAIYTRGEKTRQTSTTQTTYSQVEDMLAFAYQHGYENEHIIVYEDNGTTARTPLFERAAFKDLLTELGKTQAPEEERIHAIYTSWADRLFKDATILQVSKFIQLCAVHHILLVTPTQTFDFTKADSVAAFRFQCEQATLYIAKAIHRNYRGGNLQQS